MKRYLLIWLIFLFTFINTACRASMQSTATPTASPTHIPPTATLTSSPTPKPTITTVPSPTPFPEIDLDFELPEGDAQMGFPTAVRYSCHGCHVNERHLISGPRFISEGELPFILERGTTRIGLPEYEGKATTNRQYIIESIFLPEVYTVPGKWEKPMPTYFYQIMTDQELADILAWMATLE